MNLLAHLYLAGDAPASMIGNLTADFVKGRQIEALTPEVRVGVLHHRSIDRYTDEHPAVLRSVARIKPAWNRFSPVLVDVFYDHLLARNWEQYSTESLRAWLDTRYAVLRDNRDIVPESAAWVFDRVIQDDRMMKYSTVHGIRDSLERLSRKLKRPHDLSPATDDMLAHLDGLEADFAEFFPEMVENYRLQ